MTDDEVVRKYIGLVKWHAARRVPYRDYDDAVQDGLIGIIRAQRRFDDQIGGEWLDRWIVLSIPRSIIDGQRKRTGYRRRTDGNYRPEILSIDTVIAERGDGWRHDGEPVRLGDTLTAADCTDAAALGEGLEELLRALPLGVADRRVLDGMLDGMLLQDIAAAEGVTPSRISQRVRLIREEVARQLAT